MAITVPSALSDMGAFQPPYSNRPPIQVLPKYSSNNRNQWPTENPNHINILAVSIAHTIGPTTYDTIVQPVPYRDTYTYTKIVDRALELQRYKRVELLNVD